MTGLARRLASCLTRACFLLAYLTGMESPIIAVRLMTPTADNRGGESVVINPPRGGFFVSDQITRCVTKEYANVRLQPKVHSIPAS